MGSEYTAGWPIGSRAVGRDEQLVEVWTPEANFPALERERVIWEPVGAAQGFALELEELFRPI